MFCYVVSMEQAQISRASEERVHLIHSFASTLKPSEQFAMWGLVNNATILLPSPVLAAYIPHASSFESARTTINAMMRKAEQTDGLEASFRKIDLAVRGIVGYLYQSQPTTQPRFDSTIIASAHNLLADYEATGTLPSYLSKIENSLPQIQTSLTQPKGGSGVPSTRHRKIRAGEDWQDFMLCREVSNEAFEVSSLDVPNATRYAAILLCSRCEVANPCLRDRLNTQYVSRGGVVQGVRGGLMLSQQIQVAKRLRNGADKEEISAMVAGFRQRNYQTAYDQYRSGAGL